MKFIKITNDTTFKYLYKDEKARKWFNKIILDYTGMDLSNYTLVNNELNSGNNNKDMISDILLNKENNYVIIEMQNSKNDSEKNYWYLFRVSDTSVKKGKTYNSKNTLIIFANYVPDNEKIKEAKETLLKLELQDNRYNYVKDMLKVYEIVLPNVNKVCYNVEKKLMMMKSKSYREMKKYATDRLDNYIISKLEELSMDEEFIGLYNKEEAKIISENTAYDNGKKDGIKLGIEQGKKETQIETAKEMLKLNTISIEQISQVTKLSIEEIKNIQKEIELSSNK